MRAYLIEVEDEDEFQAHYRLDCFHARNLKGVVCPVCTGWGTAGFEYPSVDISKLDDVIPSEFLQESRKNRSMTLKEFAELKRRILPILGENRPFEPATQFGPLNGTGSGRFDDFAWLNSWTMLVREPVFTELRKTGFDLIGVPANIKFRRKQPENLVELEIKPKAHLHSSARPEQCEICGRHGTLVDLKLLGKASYVVPLPVLEAATFDDTVPLQRVLEWPTMLIANEAFAGFIAERDYTGFGLTPLELI